MADPANSRRTMLVLASLVPLLASCGSEREAVPTEDPLLERVVSVSKQINEFIYAIGAEGHLVAVDLTSIYPPQINELPKVGYHRALSAEGILSAQPSVFLTDGNVGPDAVLEQLEKVGIPIRTMKPGNDMEDAQHLLTELGVFFHREAAADSVLADWKAGMEAVASDTAHDGRRPRVMIIHFGQIANNYLAVGPGSPADRMIRWAGGTNALDSAGGMTRLTPELIARTSPDIVVATDLGFDRYGSAEAFAAMPGLELTPAAKNGRIYRIEEQEIIYFGPRTPATIRKLEQMLHP